MGLVALAGWGFALRGRFRWFGLLDHGAKDVTSLRRWEVCTNRRICGVYFWLGPTYSVLQDRHYVSQLYSDSCLRVV